MNKSACYVHLILYVTCCLYKFMSVKHTLFDVTATGPFCDYTLYPPEIFSVMCHRINHGVGMKIHKAALNVEMAYR